MSITSVHMPSVLLALYVSLFVVRYIVALQEMPTFLRLFRDAAPEPFDSQPVKFALLLAAISLPLAFVAVLPTLMRRGWRFFEPKGEADLQGTVDDLVAAYEESQ